MTVPAPTAHAAAVGLEEIVVTARRTEEALQDVPISMTVYNQEALDERNIVNGADLATYTPSLAVNTRFGADQATFAIRGFTQELRTAASVAVYFADVVAQRGSAAVTAGDGAGPGAFFDLQNVQVLKGPQGTLFGRNTTGGAILLVPQQPTSELEGYFELSGGDYDMERAQGVVNVPISDTARARFGFDQMDREGYMDNKSAIGPDNFLDVNYLSGRGSLILELTESVENYTILTYMESKNNGALMGLFACSPGFNLAFAAGCQNLLDHQGNDFYAIENDTLDPVAKLKQRQAINTTTWEVNDNFSVKNIIAYGDLVQTTRTSTFGTNFVSPLNNTHLTFYPTGQWPGLPTNSQTNLVEEFRFEGTALDDALTWQAGLYYEKSEPDGVSGALSPIILNCPQLGEDVSAWECQTVIPLSGSVISNLAEIQYLNKAVYSQATYDFTEQFRLTAGLRFTSDNTRGTGNQVVYDGFPAAPAPAGPPALIDGAYGFCGSTVAERAADCEESIRQKSEAPTWLIDFDYLPTAELMTYVKYARGYRQGSVNIVGPDGAKSFEPEEVDAYEVGAKTTFDGAVSGAFNIALFYNELNDQQIQVGYQDVSGKAAPTTAIYNAGASTIQGLELDTTFLLTDGLLFNVVYAYLDTRLDEFEYPAAIPPPFTTALPAAVQGGELTFSPHHNVTATLNYQLPVPADIGAITATAGYTYISEQFATGNSPTFGELDSYNLVNLNLGWQAIAGSAFDAAFFVTNLTDEEYTAYVPGIYDTLAGMEFRAVGEPRMWGVRLKYNFGP
ncbi:MAG TPA: TonB-dependent receptor [Halioglobus sp.]